MNYETLKKMDAEDRDEFLDSLTEEEQAQLTEQIIKEYSNEYDTGNVFSVGNCFFIFRGDEIVEMSDDVSYSPRGGWFPDLVTGLSDKRKALVEAIINAISADEDDLVEWLTDVADTYGEEFDKDDILEYCEDEEDEDRMKLARKLIREVRKNKKFISLWDFYCDLRYSGLDEGCIYYEWEGEFIDLADNVWEAGELRGTYESLSDREWLEVLVNIDSYKVKAVNVE